ncbi:MAG: type IV secretion system protein [Erythrobacter sp.]
MSGPMTGMCDSALSEMGGGIAAALQAVDCVASGETASAFGQLFAPGGALEAALVILLTLYVAFFAISLMLGRSNLSIRALLPRMILVGMVLAFSTSWVAFRSFIWPLFVETPDYLATILTSSDGSATRVFAEKLDVVFAAVEQASQGQQNFEAFSPAGLMWLGAVMLLLGTVGILVTSRIALALLVAIGPIFVVMALFNGTRGLFTGWLKGLVMLALTPLFAVLGGSIMLELAVPVLSALGQTPGQIDPRAAMAFFLVGAVHVALMVMVLKVAGTMVSGWQVFGIAAAPAESTGGAPTLSAAAAPRPADPRYAAAAASAPRRTDVAGVVAPIAANDPGVAASGTRARETRVYATSAASNTTATGSAAPSRTRGIGNRFRPAQSRASARPTENVT